VLGAIFIIEPRREREGSDNAADPSASLSVAPQLGTPLACVEILGCSVLGRLAEDLQRNGAQAVSILADGAFAQSGGVQAAIVPVFWTDNSRRDATRELARFADRGFTEVILIRASVYAEIDFASALKFHRDQVQPSTPIVDDKGSLDIWIVDPSMPIEGDLFATLRATEAVPYLTGGYVNRLENAHDLRRLISDSLLGRCRLRPYAIESRPGVWLADGAQVHRAARIVAPAFIGRGAKISEQCLITRCSNVESNSHVDYGTVVEDSSILPNSYVGIGLDVAHSIVDGNNLLNLQHGVVLEVSDPGLIRQTRPRKDSLRQALVSFGFGEPVFSPAEETTPGKPGFGS
jgi:hypothetical protein